MGTRPSEAPDRLRLRLVQAGLLVSLGLLALLVTAIARAPDFRGGPLAVVLLAVPAAIPAAGLAVAEREVGRTTATRATGLVTPALLACVILALPYVLLGNLSGGWDG